MTDSQDFEGKLGLADFLSDLRTELDEATKRAREAANDADGEALRLEIDEITLSLDVAFTVGKKGEGTAGAKAKFWVLASVDANVKAELSSQRVDTQHLTLTLKPRIEETRIDESGVVQHLRRSLDVSGELETDEENPDWEPTDDKPPRTAPTG